MPDLARGLLLTRADRSLLEHAAKVAHRCRTIAAQHVDEATRAMASAVADVLATHNVALDPSVGVRVAPDADGRPHALTWSTPPLAEALPTSANPPTNPPGVRTDGVAP